MEKQELRINMNKTKYLVTKKRIGRVKDVQVLRGVAARIKSDHYLVE